MKNLSKQKEVELFCSQTVFFSDKVTSFLKAQQVAPPDSDQPEQHIVSKVWNQVPDIIFIPVFPQNASGPVTIQNRTVSRSLAENLLKPETLNVAV